MAIAKLRNLQSWQMCSRRPSLACQYLNEILVKVLKMARGAGLTQSILGGRSHISMIYCMRRNSPRKHRRDLRNHIEIFRSLGEQLHAGLSLCSLMFHIIRLQV